MLDITIIFARRHGGATDFASYAAPVTAFGVLPYSFTAPVIADT